jgi:hypothetical protein
VAIDQVLDILLFEYFQRPAYILNKTTENKIVESNITKNEIN